MAKKPASRTRARQAVEPAGEPLAVVFADPVVSGAAVNSVEELVALLKQIHDQCQSPVLATVVRRDGDCLSVGLGRPFSVLTFAGPGGEPPYFVSVGTVMPTEPVAFSFHRQHSEFRRRNAVTLDEASVTVGWFVRSSDLPLPDTVQWEEG